MMYLKNWLPINKRIDCIVTHNLPWFCRIGLEPTRNLTLPVVAAFLAHAPLLFYSLAGLYFVLYFRLVKPTSTDFKNLKYFTPPPPLPLVTASLTDRNLFRHLVNDQVVQTDQRRSQVAGRRLRVRGRRRKEVRPDVQGDRRRAGPLRRRATGSAAVRRVRGQIARRSFFQGKCVDTAYNGHTPLVMIPSCERIFRRNRNTQ